MVMGEGVGVVIEVVYIVVGELLVVKCDFDEVLVLFVCVIVMLVLLDDGIVEIDLFYGLLNLE